MATHVPICDLNQQIKRLFFTGNDDGYLCALALLENGVDVLSLFDMTATKVSIQHYSPLLVEKRALAYFSVNSKY